MLKMAVVIKCGHYEKTTGYPTVFTMGIASGLWLCRVRCVAGKLPEHDKNKMPDTSMTQAQVTECLKLSGRDSMDTTDGAIHSEKTFHESSRPRIVHTVVNPAATRRRIPPRHGQ